MVNFSIYLNRRVFVMTMTDIVAAVVLFTVVVLVVVGRGGCAFVRVYVFLTVKCTTKAQWLEHLRDHGNLFETQVVRGTEG